MLKQFVTDHFVLYLIICAIVGVMVGIIFTYVSYVIYMATLIFALFGGSSG